MNDEQRMDVLIGLIRAGRAEVCIDDEIWHGEFLRDQIDLAVEKDEEQDD